MSYIKGFATSDIHKGFIFKEPKLCKVYQDLNTITEEKDKNYYMEAVSLNNIYRRSVIYKKDNLIVSFNGNIYDSAFYERKVYENEAALFYELFTKHGTKCFNNINGDYAVCIYDINKYETYLARSPFGVIPLFYMISDKMCVWASDLGFIIDENNPKECITDNSLRKYVNEYIYWRFHGRCYYTPYENVKKVMPGFWVKINRYQKEKVKEFWKPSSYKIKEKNVGHKFLDLFLQSIRNNISYDYNKKITINLSGGVDSSCITCAIKYLKDIGDNIPEVMLHNYVYLGAGDEKQYTESVVNLTDFPIRYFDRKNNNIMFNIKEPLKKTLLPEETIMYASNDTDNELKVFEINSYISGSGSDQIFTNHLSFLSKYIKKGRFIYLYRLLGRYSKEYNTSKSSMFFYYCVKPLFVKKQEFRSKISSYYTKDHMKNHYRKYKAYSARKMYSDPSVQTDYEYLLYMDQWSDSGPCFFDVKYPFLNKELVEFCFSLPGEIKLHKKVLRESMKNYIPDIIYNRNNKGSNSDNFFEGARNNWDQIERVINYVYLEELNILKKGSIKDLLTKFKLGVMYDIHENLRLIVLEFWLHSIFD